MAEIYSGAFFASLVVNVEFEPVSAVLNKIRAPRRGLHEQRLRPETGSQSSEHMASSKIRTGIQISSAHILLYVRIFTIPSIASHQRY